MAMAVERITVQRSTAPHARSEEAWVAFARYEGTTTQLVVWGSTPEEVLHRTAENLHTQP